MSVCYNAVDRHVASGKGEQVALIHDSPVTDTVRKITYNELLDQVRGRQIVNSFRATNQLIYGLES